MRRNYLNRLDEHQIPKTISFPFSVINEIDWMCAKKNPNRMFKSRTEAVISLIGVGLYLERNKGSIETGEFKKDMMNMIESEKTMEWLHDLTSTQIEGLKMMINVVQDGRQKRIGV